MPKRATDPLLALVATARRLQAPGGCPWDRAQTVRSLLPHLVEETWEVFWAERHRRRDQLKEELGDVLYTVLFLSLIAERRGWFTLRSVVTSTRRKMIRRHPHVFGARHAKDANAAYASWQAIKRRERSKRGPIAKKLRPLLVEIWEALLANDQAPAAFQRTAKRYRKAH